ncbi:MAG: AMP-binding protein [Spirochaetota bacterium]
MPFGFFKKKTDSSSTDGMVVEHPEAKALGQILEETAASLKKKEAITFEGKTYSFKELDEQASRVANGLRSLGIQAGDRVAMMLPNIPEFVFSFYGIQKLGAIAVPFNTLYKGREIIHILNDSGARAIITLTNSANLFNEIREDCPSLEHVIVTGQRTLVFLDPNGTANVQAVVSRDTFSSPDEAFRTFGEVFVETLKELGVSEAWYKHQGAVRVGGRKIANIVIQEIENLYIVNSVCFLDNLQMDDFFKVIYVTPELKDKVVEPMSSVREVTGSLPTLEMFKNAFTSSLRARLGIEIEPGQLKRDEKFGYEKNRALAYKH